MSHISHLGRRNGKTMLIVHDQPLILLAGEVHNSNSFTATQGYLFGMDMTDPALKTPQDVEEYGWFARTLNDLMPLLAERIGTAKLQAVCSERKEDCTLDFGDFRVMAAFDHPILCW